MRNSQHLRFRAM